jgi:hypothetical protein
VAALRTGRRRAGGSVCGHHIAAHATWERVLVLEDDAVLDPPALAVTLRLLEEEDEAVDVCLLTHNPVCVQYDPTPLARDERSGRALHRVWYSQTSAAYVVGRHYAPTLADHIGTAVADMDPGSPAQRWRAGVVRSGPVSGTGGRSTAVGHPRPTTAWTCTGPGSCARHGIGGWW